MCAGRGQGRCSAATDQNRRAVFSRRRGVIGAPGKTSHHGRKPLRQQMLSRGPLPSRHRLASELLFLFSRSPHGCRLFPTGALSPLAWSRSLAKTTRKFVLHINTVRNGRFARPASLASLRPSHTTCAMPEGPKTVIAGTGLYCSETLEDSAGLEELAPAWQSLATPAGPPNSWFGPPVAWQRSMPAEHCES